MKIHDVEQGSDAWLLAKCGKAGASEFSSILAKGQGKTRASYLRRIVAERLTGKPTETFKNGHTDRGQEQEPLARLAMEARTDYQIERVGFIEHDTLLAGCSPDGLIGKDGGAEIKCVIPTVQVETILRGEYPPDHVAQVQGNLWITGRKWWDFCSFSQDMPARHRVYIFRVERDEPYIALLEKEVRAFLADVDRTLERLSLAGKSTEELLRMSLKPEAVAA